MFKRFTKTDYWKEIQGIDGFHRAVEKLGTNWQKLNEEGQGYNAPDSIWAQLAQTTEMENKNTLNVRKWLYQTWHRNSKNVFTSFSGNKRLDQPSFHSNKSETLSDNHLEALKSQEVDTLSMISSNNSFNSGHSCSRTTRTKQIQAPQATCHFTLTYEEWQRFYNHKTAQVADNWAHQLSTYITRANITCVIAFKSHGGKKKNSRKKNSNVFSCRGQCKIKSCQAEVSVIVDKEPSKKGNPSIFTVYLFGAVNHNREADMAGRPLQGVERASMGRRVMESGALAVYEENLRLADENLLKEGNVSQVPSTDVLKTAGQEYTNRYRLDEDMFKEVRILREITERLDQTSTDVKGFIQTTGEWPFTNYFFTETQLDRFIQYRKNERYTYLHIDATGSVIRKLRNQKAVYFYSMVYKDESVTSSILPLSGALLCDQNTASITSYFNHVLAKLALRSQTARPSFIVIDFSPALLNSALSAFNNENIHTYLRRCNNILNRTYTTSQLKDLTIIRLCCSHVMKAFARSVYKIEASKDARRQLISLFAVLLNIHNIDGAMHLYEQIINIYGDPYADNASQKLKSLLDTSDLTEEDIDKYLDVRAEDEEQSHFLDEIDIKKDAIIHQSPFSIKACSRIPLLKRLMSKEKPDKQIVNPLYSVKIIHLLYKWFAYVPLWSSVMTDFLDRYANDGKNQLTGHLDFGHGRISNAPMESYFSIVKQSILQKNTRLRPMNFLLEMYLHTQARFKAEQYGIAQSSSRRKTKNGNEHPLNIEEVWGRRSRSNPSTRKSYYFDKTASQTKAYKLSSTKASKPTTQSNQQPPEAASKLSVWDIHSDSDDTDSSSSSIKATSQKSLGFSQYSSDREIHQTGTFIIPIGTPLAIKTTTTATSDTNDNSCNNTTVSSTASVSSNDTEAKNTDQSLRRTSRRHIPNSKYINDYVSPTISPIMSTVTTPKRLHSSSSASSNLSPLPSKGTPTVNVCVPNKTTVSTTTKTLQSVRFCRKKAKLSPTNSPNPREFTIKVKQPPAVIGSVQLIWPRYGIRNAIYGGQVYSVTNTCPLDTGLFVLYYAYKAGTEKFRDLLDNNTLSAFTNLRRTFQLVDSDGWTTARLHWLVAHDILKSTNAAHQYDIENTLTEIVFRFVQPMQDYPIRSECSCTACPKRLRQSRSVDITLAKLDGLYPNYLPAFVEDRDTTCGENLGSVEPKGYPAKYWRDDSFPVRDLENNQERTETRYICQAKRITRKTQFKHPTPPFLIMNVGTDVSLMSELPQVMKVNKLQYRLTAGTNNTSRHFTAIIRANNGEYVRFNDLHPKGCFPLDATVFVDFAIYALII